MRILSLLLFAPFVAVPMLRAQETGCNTTLIGSSTAGELSYRDRHDRCEGLFALPVSGSARLDLVSVTDSFPLDLEPAALGTMHLSWKAPTGSSSVQVRGNSLRYKLYYEMDASSPAAKGVFDWCMDVLKKVDIRRPEIGLLAWVILPGPHNLQVYLPLTASRQQVAPTNQPSVEVVLVPTVELSEVYYSINEQRADGTYVGAPPRPLPVGAGYYPQNRPIRLSIPVQTGSHYYQVKVSATVAQGGTTGAAVRIYYAR